MRDPESVARDVCTTFGQADALISQIAGRQRSLITRGQLRELGIGRRAIDYALARGRLHRMHLGVYSLVPSPALPPLATEFAAVLACGASALLGAHSAAAAWSFRRAVTGDVDVIVVGKEAGRRRPGIRVHRVKALEPRDIRRHQGIPITSPARTLLDIAPDLSDRSLEWALDDAVTRRLTSHAAVKAVLAAYPNRPSSHRLRALLDPDRPTTVTRSGGEEAFLAQVRRARLPVPEVNATVGRYSADFLWRDQKVILEIDGYDFHRGRAAFERDHERDAEHQHLDYVVIRATPRQLAREPQVLLVRVAMALARRMAA